MERERDLNRLYDLLDQLRQTQGLRLLSDPNAMRGCPDQGVYFFFEPGEFRQDGRTLRVVRVGTHAVSSGSSATLGKRLRQHRGNTSGGGNHRGSVFRMHVGGALLNRFPDRYPPAVHQSWFDRDAMPDEIALESKLEDDVSAIVGAMPFLWVDIPGIAGPDSERSVVERNAIALLSNSGKRSIDAPSERWLGTWADAPAVRDSGLWNVRHVEGPSTPAFLELLEQRITKAADRKLGGTVRQDLPTPSGPQEPQHLGGEGPAVDTLVIVSCGKTKVWSKEPGRGSVPAKDAYIGPMFQASRRLAEAWGLPWVVLSAKYGFLKPGTPIEDYNVTFKDPRTNPVTDSDLRSMVNALGLSAFRSITVLGGSEYSERVRRAFAATGATVHSPVAGLPMGHMLHRLQELVVQPRPQFESPVSKGNATGTHSSTGTRVKLRTQDFRHALEEWLRTAEAEGVPSVDVRARELYRRVVPQGKVDRMPMCCNAMYALRRESDEVTEQPPSGFGSRLTVRYHLPR